MYTLGSYPRLAAFPTNGGWTEEPLLNEAKRKKRPRVASVAVVLAVLSGCAHPHPPPGPGTSQGIPPDLRGDRVILLPFQRVIGVDGDLGAELAFALKARGPRVAWVAPAELETALERSPGLDARTRDLPVDDFLAGEIRRIGDPLFGDLRRLGAVANADYALLPIQAALEPSQGGGGAVRLWAAVIEVRTGQVLWFGIAEGDPGPMGDARRLASATDRLARMLLEPEPAHESGT